MPKSRLAIPLLAVVPLFAACGGRVTVQVMADGADAGPAEDLEVQFLPFDRDSLFREMASRASTPEPQMPADLEQAADSVRVLQDAWREAEANWNNVRDSLRTISDQLDNLDRRSVEYRRLFDSFSPMEARERQWDRRRQAAFDAFDELQQGTQQRLDSVRIVIGAWEEVAFADYGDVEAELLEALGRQIAVDTTDADGVASASGGPWWVYTRLNAPDGELYWNVVTEASSDTLRLNRGNAELRRVY